MITIPQRARYRANDLVARNIEKWNGDAMEQLMAWCAILWVDTQYHYEPDDDCSSTLPQDAEWHLQFADEQPAFTTMLRLVEDSGMPLAVWSTAATLVQDRDAKAWVPFSDRTESVNDRMFAVAELARGNLLIDTATLRMAVEFLREHNSG